MLRCHLRAGLVLAALLGLVPASLSATPATAADFRICKNLSATKVHRDRRAAMARARQTFYARLAQHRRGGYQNTWVGGPQCTLRYGRFHCSYWTRICKTRRSG